MLVRRNPSVDKRTRNRQVAATFSFLQRLNRFKTPPKGEVNSYLGANRGLILRFTENSLPQKERYMVFEPI